MRYNIRSRRFVKYLTVLGLLGLLGLVYILLGNAKRPMLSQRYKGTELGTTQDNAKRPMLPRGFEGIELGTTREKVLEALQARQTSDRVVTVKDKDDYPSGLGVAVSPLLFIIGGSSYYHIEENLYKSETYPFDSVTYWFYQDKLYQIIYHYRSLKWLAELKKRFGAPDRSVSVTNDYWPMDVLAWEEGDRQFRVVVAIPGEFVQQLLTPGSAEARQRLAANPMQAAELYSALVDVRAEDHRDDPARRAKEKEHEQYLDHLC